MATEHPLSADECLHVYKTSDDTEVSCPLPVIFSTTNQCPIHGEEIIALCGLHLMQDLPSLIGLLL